MKDRLSREHWDHGQWNTHYKSVNAMTFTQPAGSINKA